MTLSFSPPTTFEFFIGGFMGHSYAVKLDETGILYSSWNSGYSDRHDEHVDVRPEDWIRLRAALDAANVWSWSSKYKPSELIVDGTNWHVAITWGDQSVKSSGDNAYPTLPGEPARSVRVPASFEALLGEIERLVGGRRCT